MCPFDDRNGVIWKCCYLCIKVVSIIIKENKFFPSPPDAPDRKNRCLLNVIYEIYYIIFNKWKKRNENRKKIIMNKKTGFSVFFQNER